MKRINILHLILCIPILILPYKTHALYKTPIDVACTIFLISNSCTPVFDDIKEFSDAVSKICNVLSDWGEVVSIACDPATIKSALDFFQDVDTAAENGISDVELFWSKLNKDPLNIVKEIMTKMKDDGAFKQTPDKFLGEVKTGIKQIGDTFVDKAKEFGDKIADAGNSFVDNTKDLFNDIFGSKNSASYYRVNKLIISIFCLWVAFVFFNCVLYC